MVDTGELTQTGGRILRVADHLDSTFCLTYGDGVGNVDITRLVEFHKAQGCQATMTAIRPPGRFGALSLDGNLVVNFEEKPKGDNRWINGGFMVCEPSVIDRIEGDETVFERAPLDTLAFDHQLAVWKHDGFWQAMDTLRDKSYLEQLWSSGKAPWRIWESLQS